MNDQRNRGKKKLFLKLSFVFLILFIITAFFVEKGLFYGIDQAINLNFMNNQNVFLTEISLILAILFEPVIVFIASLILFALFYLKRFNKKILFFLTSSFLAGSLILITKELFQRARPENLIESGFSFPSGHTTISIIFFGGLISFFFNQMKTNSKVFLSLISVVSVLIISFSRLYLGVHWFSDILGGIFFGAFVLFLMLSFFEKE
jgi:undecaprenyl-diphosphatase